MLENFTVHRNPLPMLKLIFLIVITILFVYMFRYMRKNGEKFDIGPNINVNESNILYSNPLDGQTCMLLDNAPNDPYYGQKCKTANVQTYPLLDNGLSAVEKLIKEELDGAAEIASGNTNASDVGELKFVVSQRHKILPKTVVSILEYDSEKDKTQSTRSGNAKKFFSGKMKF